MKIRSVQWNIGGGKIRDPEADSTKIENYKLEGLAYIIEKLSLYQPDIITLQESHADEHAIQAQTISEALELPYFINDPYDQSHIDASQKLCQSIVSRFPIKEHAFSFYFNPPYRKTMENGEEWTSHDKGMSTCVIDVGDREVVLQTSHLIPFQKFNVDLEDENGKKVQASIEALVEKSRTPYLFQGDLNYEDIRTLLPNIYVDGLHEVGGAQGTTPKGKIYDHVFCRGLKQSSQGSVDSTVLTDHFPIISDFEM
jgi:endonuclease/exonuclease/phosphatase (EEP) superfamily protein YafD